MIVKSLHKGYWLPVLSNQICLIGLPELLGKLVFVNTQILVLLASVEVIVCHNLEKNYLNVMKFLEEILSDRMLAIISVLFRIQYREKGQW